MTLAMLLEEIGIDFMVLEARSRLGGRILTLNESEKAPLEMGATWFGHKHKNLVHLLKKLNLDHFNQLLGESAIYEAISTSPPQVVNLPPNDEPSHRISGGTVALIDALSEKINPDNIRLNQAVNKIIFNSDSVEVQTTEEKFFGSKIINTIPLNLFFHSIHRKPELPEHLLSLMAKTHTWMGESIKVGIRYTTPFWRNEGKSGTIFSNVGPIPEMYDHSNAEDNLFALVGFFNGNYYTVDKESRRQMTLTQLEKYYGKQVHDFLEYREKLWIREKYTYHPYKEHILPHENNGNHHYRIAYMDEKLYLAGAETAGSFPGYMDGAVESAFFVFNLLKRVIQN